MVQVVKKSRNPIQLIVYFFYEFFAAFLLFINSFLVLQSSQIESDNIRHDDVKQMGHGGSKFKLWKNAKPKKIKDSDDDSSEQNLNNSYSDDSESEDEIKDNGFKPRENRPQRKPTVNRVRLRGSKACRF